MGTSPAISVVVPAYNEEKLLPRCLSSLKHQDFTLPYEIIVVNNNSTDKTEQIARSFGVTVATEARQSVVAARQRGLTLAQGEVVVGADSDCTYPPNWLSTLYTNFQKSPRVVAVGGPAEADPNPVWGHWHYQYGFALVYFIYRLTGYVIYLGAFNFAYRRTTFLQLGGYHTYLDFGGDEWDPLSRLRNAGTIIFDPKLVIHLSLRRYRVGFWKFLFVHALYYYSLGYILAKIFHRPLIKAGAVRNI